MDIQTQDGIVDRVAILEKIGQTTRRNPYNERTGLNNIENGYVKAMYIASLAGGPMQEQKKVKAIAGVGLEGDRYSLGKGSFNQGEIGRRQVTLVNALFFERTPFEYEDSRRNIVTVGVELNNLMLREFQIGTAHMRGVKYCRPCHRPSNLCGRTGFFFAFYDRGGIVAEVLQSGMIQRNDPIFVLRKEPR